MTVDGWFVRGLGPSVGIRSLDPAEGKPIRGYVHIAGLVGGGLALVGAAVLFGAWLVVGAPV